MQALCSQPGKESFFREAAEGQARQIFFCFCFPIFFYAYGRQRGEKGKKKGMKET